MAASTIIAADSFTVKTIQNYEFAKGTYDGDPTKDGTIQARMDEQIDENDIDSKIEELTMAELLKNFSASAISIEVTNEVLPLEPTGYTEFETITISNGKMHIPDEPYLYIRTK